MKKEKWYLYGLIVIIAFFIFTMDIVSVLGWEALGEKYQFSPFTILLCTRFTTTIIWCILSLLVLNFSKKKFQFNIFENKSTPSTKSIIICVLLTIIITVVQYILWGGFKPWLEFLGFTKRFNNLGIIGFIAQCIYYIFEMLVALIMVVFGQKAGEVLTKSNKIPWGAIIFGFIWGLPHWLTQGDLVVGIVSIVLGFIIGLPYLLLNRNTKLTWFFMFIMFLL